MMVMSSSVIYLSVHSERHSASCIPVTKNPTNKPVKKTQCPLTSSRFTFRGLTTTPAEPSFVGTAHGVAGADTKTPFLTKMYISWTCGVKILITGVAA